MIHIITNLLPIQTPAPTRKRPSQEQPPAKEPPLKQAKSVHPQPDLTLQQKAALLPVLSDDQFKQTLKHLQLRHIERLFFDFNLTTQQKILQYLPTPKRNAWLPQIAEQLNFPRDQALFNSLTQEQGDLIFPFITLEQLRSASRGIKGELLDNIRDEMTFAEETCLIKERRVIIKAPHVIALGMLFPELFDNLKHYSHFMTPLQINAVVAVLDIPSLSEFFQYASEETQTAIKHSLVPSQKKELKEFAASNLLPIQDTLSRQEKTSEAMSSELQILATQNKTCSTKKECKELSQQLNRCRNFLIFQIQELKNQKIIIEMIATLLDKRAYSTLLQKSGRISKTLHSLLTEYFMTQNSIAAQIEIKRRQFLSQETADGLIPMSDDFDLEDFATQYDDAKYALEEFGIFCEDLDRVNLSWEEVVAAGIESPDDLIENLIDTPEKLADFIHSGNRIHHSNLWKWLKSWFS